MFEAIIELGCFLFFGTLFFSQGAVLLIHEIVGFMYELFCLLLASLILFLTMRVYHRKVQNLVIVLRSQLAGSVPVSV